MKIRYTLSFLMHSNAFLMRLYVVCESKYNMLCLHRNLLQYFVVFQVYELTLHYTQHQDHNVVTGALELLQQLFRTPPPELLHALTSLGGIAQVSVSKDESAVRSRSGSIVELIGKMYFQ